MHDLQVSWANACNTWYQQINSLKCAVEATDLPLKGMLFGDSFGHFQMSLP